MRGRTAGGAVPQRGDLEWREQAACVGKDPAMFSPEPLGNHISAANKAIFIDAVITALKVCGRCPVKDACLADAYATGDRWNVRGGTTGEQRVAARRRQLRESREATEVSA